MERCDKRLPRCDCGACEASMASAASAATRSWLASSCAWLAVTVIGTSRRTYTSPVSSVHIASMRGLFSARMGNLRSSAASGLCLVESDRGLLRAPWGFAGEAQIYRALDTPATNRRSIFAQFAASSVRECGPATPCFRRPPRSTRPAPQKPRHGEAHGARTAPFAFAMKKKDERELYPYVDSPQPSGCCPATRKIK